MVIGDTPTSTGGAKPTSMAILISSFHSSTPEIHSPVSEWVTGLTSMEEVGTEPTPKLFMSPDILRNKLVSVHITEVHLTSRLHQEKKELNIKFFSKESLTLCPKM